MAWSWPLGETLLNCLWSEEKTSQTEVHVIHLMSITRGVLAQSPEPEARDKVLDNNPDRIGIWKCWFLRRGDIPGHIGRRPAWEVNAQPLRQPCSDPKMKI